MCGRDDRDGGDAVRGLACTSVENMGIADAIPFDEALVVPACGDGFAVGEHDHADIGALAVEGVADACSPDAGTDDTEIATEVDQEVGQVVGAGSDDLLRGDVDGESLGDGAEVEVRIAGASRDAELA